MFFNCAIRALVRNEGLLESNSVVIDVVDIERQEIMNMLQGLPDEESRVIGVINKCDTKQKKSHDFVCDLLTLISSRSDFIGVRSHPKQSNTVTTLPKGGLVRLAQPTGLRGWHQR